MHVAASELRLSAEDIRQTLAEFSRGLVPVTVESVDVDAGVVRARIRGEGLLPLPVTLTATVDEVRPRWLSLRLDVERLDYLPAGLRGAAMDLVGRQLRVPGVSLQDGRLTVHVDQLPLPVRFELTEVAFEPGQVRVGLRDLVLDGMAPAVAAPDGAAPGVPEPATADDATSAAADGDAAVAAADTPEPPLTLVAVPRPEREVEDEHRAGYQRVRARLQEYIDRKGPGWLQPAVPWLLLLPDFFAFLVRLAREPQVPTRAKLLAGAVLGYIVLPVDLVPDMLPAVGLLDDLALTLIALESLVHVTPAGVLRRVWPGDEDVLNLVRDGLQWVVRYYPRPLVQRLRDWLHGRAGGTAGGAGGMDGAAGGNGFTPGAGARE